MPAPLREQYALLESNLGFAAIFLCVALGFAFLRNVDKREKAIAFWSIGFGLNSLGFLFWSNVLPFGLAQLYLIGEVFHVAGFLALVYGVHVFFGHGFDKRAAAVLAACLLSWLFSVYMLKDNLALGLFLLRLFRSLIFTLTGLSILLQGSARRLAGKRLAGISMIAWGAYVLLTAIWRIVESSDLQFGIMAGFHILAAFGMVAMIVDRMHARAEETESRAKKLEGLLPICSYCKKIRDDRNQWQVLELYIEDRSAAEFSHGICPDCMKKHHPDYDGS
jgi:hypothetical protein